LFGRLLRAVTLGMIVTFAAFNFLFPSVAFPRWLLNVLLVYNGFTTLCCVTIGRLLHRFLWGSLRKNGIGAVQLLVVGAGPAGQDLVARVHRRPWLGYHVVGFVDDMPGRTRARGVPILGTTEQLADIVQTHAIEEVLIAMPEASRAVLTELINRCDRDGISIKILPDVFHMLANEVQISDLDGLPLLAVRDVALRGWRRTLKRAMDVVISGTALVFLSPLILLLAVLVKLESRGPAFFIQERMGLDMRPFPILKIRSMRPDAEAATGAVWARRGDPRVTRLGRFIRRTNLDELPQLINVLLGHMSIVGPRPERPEFVSDFRRRIPRYAERHRERGGMTGWAQVNGLRGDTSIEERTKYDLYYIENWSLLLDFKIIARTFLLGFKDPNAY
jgi:exopolysaccharide biosynthesis polyprenyl glycosylphosphotransferase